MTPYYNLMIRQIDREAVKSVEERKTKVQFISDIGVWENAGILTETEAENALAHLNEMYVD